MKLRGLFIALACFSAFNTIFASSLQVGFAKSSITPEVPDRFDDLNKNARYDKGEPFVDGNGNGVFDAVYIAGFHNNRPAQGVHDELSAVASVLEFGSKKIAIVALDAIGFMKEEIDEVRMMIPPSLGVSSLTIHSTHNHEAPDTQGLWGASFTKSGVDREHMEFIKRRIVSAIVLANLHRRPATMHLANIEGDDDFFGIIDTRSPNVIDKGIRAVVFTEYGSKSVIGSITNFANHTETLWADNLLLTSDWPGYVREGLEKGRSYSGGVVSEGLGGIAMVLNGNIGGLTSTLPDTKVFDFGQNSWISGATFEKAKAQGYGIARSIENAWINGTFKVSEVSSIEVKSKELDLPIDNLNFILARRMGLIRRNIFEKDKTMTKSEVSLIKIGAWHILNIPGELYPEIALGGVESPAGADFGGKPMEIPPLKSLMNGKLNFIVNLANDSIGYIIPHSQWDRKKPFTYGDSSAPYGEGNSMGPETAPIIHKAAVNLLTN